MRIDRKFPYIVIAVAYFFIYLFLFLKNPLIYLNDSTGYQLVASAPIWSQDFWGATRPLTTPFFLKLTGNTRESFVWFQFLFTVACWIVFAASVAYSLRNRKVAVFAFAVLCLMSLHKDFYFWAKAVLSEGLSNAFLVLSLGVFVFAAEYCNRAKAKAKWLQAKKQILASVVFFIPVFFWSFTRDPNAYFLVGSMVLAWGAFLIWKKRLRSFLPAYVTLSALIVSLFFFQEHTANLGKQRWQFPMVNIIGKRILPDPEKVKYFSERGMPLNDKVWCFKGRWASSCGRDWSGFGDWIETRGKKVYIGFLLSRPLEHMAIPLVRWQDFFSTSVWGYSGIKDTPVWQSVLGYFVFPKGPRLLFQLALAIAFAIWVFRKTGWDYRLSTPIVLLTLVYPMMFLNWHGDVMEFVRHCVGLWLQFKLGIWLLLLVTLDRALDEKLVKKFWR